MAPILPLAQAVAGQYEHATRPDLRRDREVGGLVAHDGRGAEVDAELVRRLHEQPWLGLAAIAIRAPGWLTFRRVMRAHVDAIELSTGLLELRRELSGHRMEDVFGEVPASHDGLVGHDDRGDAVLVQAADGLGRPGEETEPSGMIDISHFFGERSIAVDEHCGPTGHCRSVRRTPRQLKGNWRKSWRNPRPGRHT